MPPVSAAAGPATSGLAAAPVPAAVAGPTPGPAAGSPTRVAAGPTPGPASTTLDAAATRPNPGPAATTLDDAARPIFGPATSKVAAVMGTVSGRTHLPAGPAGGVPAGTSPDDLVGSVHSWDMSTGVDGPGSRFVVFLAGCPLRCLYCHNPDTWRIRGGQRTTLGDMWKRVEGYTRFIKVAGGGLTVSGGEPLLQPRFTEALLRRAREAGLHTALDTSGYLGDKAPDNLLDAADLVLLDIKSANPVGYRALTRMSLEPTLRFARRLSDRGNRMWIRFVLVPGVTDDEHDVDELAEFCAGLSSVERVEVLPFHRLGAAKYEELGLRFPLADTRPPAPELLDRVRAQFRSHGLIVH